MVVWHKTQLVSGDWHRNLISAFSITMVVVTDEANVSAVTEYCEMQYLAEGARHNAERVRDNADS